MKNDHAANRIVHSNPFKNINRYYLLYFVTDVYININKIITNTSHKMYNQLTIISLKGRVLTPVVTVYNLF